MILPLYVSYKVLAQLGKKLTCCQDLIGKQRLASQHVKMRHTKYSFDCYFYPKTQIFSFW